MSARNLVALAGGAIGFLIAGPAGFSFGFTLGGLVGALLFPEKIKGPRMKDLEVQISTYGVAIPICYGWNRVAGNVIWATDIIEKKKTKREFLGPKIIKYKYFGNWSVAICEGPARIRRIWADSKQVWGPAEDKADKKNVKKYAEFISVFYGTETEMPSSMMETYEGAGNVPSYRGITRVDFSMFPLKNFGNRLPSINVELVARPDVLTGWTKVDDVPDTMNLQEIVRLINIRAGLEEEDFDVTGLDADVHGFFINKEASARNMLEPLMGVYFFDGIETDGIVRYQHRNQQPLLDVPEVDLGSSGGGRSEVLLTERRTQEIEMPAEITVKYPSKKIDYNQNAQKARRAYETQWAEQRTVIDVPITMTDADAKKSAEVMLLASWAGRINFELTLPRTYIGVDPGDVINVNRDGHVYSVYIDTVDFGADGLIKITGRSHDYRVYNGMGLPPAEPPPQRPPTDDSIVSPTVFHFIDGPLIYETYNDYAGMFVAARGFSNEAPWPGGELERSRDNGASWELIDSLPEEAAIGTCSTALGDHTSHCFMDDTNTVTVVMGLQTLTSVERLTLYNDGFANLAMIGDELVQFQTATLLDSVTMTYQLSGFIRGMRGTDWAMSTHAVGDRFILITDTTIGAVAIENAELETVAYFRAVTEDEDETTVTNQIYYTLESKYWKPLAPSHVVGTRDGSDNLTITWDRRARKDFEWKDTLEVPLDETAEQYAVEIYNGVALVRTINVTAPTCTYSAAQQTTDLGGPSSAISVKVYQKSPRFGRGYARSAVV